ncbi:acyltransferase family protein [Paenibacillus sp.]|jgi:peptidoglycan/LPS O-acetylase OafA/YrhL|uniref:acyltransferase family protein n=1 Tax=Paenibacillus sp. TaxID=58172 RepID=UPI00282341BF|nr:acyltransferase family protein [Paenibacillus sp.]MDR0270889.1 acetyltransferase [Paenibacillus sp.]
MSNQHHLNKRYMPGLDGLRTLAVFFVVLYHLNFNWAPGGFLGVSIFFVLSGYLITDLLTAEWSRNHTIDLKAFWIRRCRRLLPAMLVMMAAVVAWVTLFNPSLMSVLRGDVVSSLFYVNNWYLIFHQVSYFEKFGPISPFGHMWSLAVEEQFYLLWPLLMLLGMKLLKKRGPVVLLIMALAALSAFMMMLLYDQGSDPSRVYYGTDTRAFSLLIGAALSILWPSQKLSTKVSAKTRLALDGMGIIGLVSVFVMVWMTNEYESFLYPGGFLLLSLMTAMIIASAAHPASLTGMLLGLKPLRWLGSRSYSIYIWHYPIIVLTARADSDPNVSRVLIQLAASIILASLSYKYIEEPIRGGLIGRAWNNFRKGRVHLSRIPLKGWITFASVLVLTIVSCAGFAMRAPVNASILQQESAPVTSTKVSSEQGGYTDETPADVQSPKETKTPEDVAIKAGDSGIPAPGNEVIDPKNDSKEDQGHDDAATSAINPEDTSKANKKTDQPDATNQTEITKQTAKSKKPQKTDDSRDSNDDGQKNAPDVPKAGKGKSVTVIGDSVILDAEPFLQKRIPGAVIDGKIGRQMTAAPKLVTRLRAEGKLSSQLVIELGTNGPFSSKQLMTLLDSLQDVQRIVLVNVRVPSKWESIVNTSIKKAAASYPNTTLLDWNSASKGKSYFEPDRVHLKPQGGKALADLIAQELGY